MKRILLEHKTAVAFLMLLSLCCQGAGLLLPKLIGDAINAYPSTLGLSPSVSVQFVVIIVFVFLTSLAQSILEIATAEKVAFQLRQQLQYKISTFSLDEVLEANPAKLLTNLTSDIDAVKIMVSQGISGLLSAMVILLGASALLLSLDWRLAIMVFLAMLFIALTFVVIISSIRKLFKQARALIDNLNQMIAESIHGAAIIRVLNIQGKQSLKFSEINLQAKNIGLTILRHFATMIPLVTFISSFATVLVLKQGGKYVVEQTMSLGEIASFISYLGILVFPILALGFTGNLFAQARASLSRIEPILNLDPKPQPELHLEPILGSLSFSKVSLTIKEKRLLKNVSFELKPGSRTAIVGPTAAGKSLLLNLAKGLISPTEGQIFIDSNIEPARLRQQISMVFQEPFLYQGTLKENVCFHPEVTQEGWTKALETSELAAFVATLPLKENTSMAERGTTLSGGQKQRLMLARALASEPKILLLDDFTSRLDFRTEKRIQEAIRQNYPELTILSVSQRIAPIVDFEQILVLIEGSILANGTHLQLLQTCPEYQQIFESQKSTQNYE